MRLDGYIRVSRVAGRSGETYITKKIQLQQIKAWAAQHGHELALVHEEEDQSGGRADRPKWQEAIGRVEAGATDGVIVAKLDRFARSVVDALTAVRRIDAAGGQFVSVAENFDTTNPHGRFTLTLFLALAELELDRIRDTWDVSQREAVQRGVHIASRAPTGYQRRDTNPSNGRPSGPLVPDPRAAPAIRELFRRRADGHGWTALARYLDEEGVVGPYGASTWTPSAAQKIIRNRVYLGEARSGRHVNPTAHAPLVSRAEWEAAQGRVSVEGVRHGDGLLLTGLVRCAGCRYLMKADMDRDSRTGERMGVYRCRRRHAAGECPEPAFVLARILDPHVEALFLEWAKPGVGEPVRGDDELAAAARDVEEAEAELDSYLGDVELRKLVGQERFLAMVAPREAAIRDARNALATVSRRRPARSVPRGVRLEDEWPRLTVPERRQLLLASMDAVMVRRAGRGAGIPVADRSRVLWAGEAPDTFPRRGRRVPLEPFLWTDAPVAAVAVG